MTESSRIEYKRELSDSLEKEAVAFLNSKEGGVIFIGVDPKSMTPVGLTNSDQTQLQVKDRLINNIAPSILGLFDIHLEELLGQQVLKITLASGPEKPYHIKRYGMSARGCYIRIGSASQPMSQQIIEELFAKRVRRTIGRSYSPRQELTFEQLKIYYNERNLTLNNRFAQNLEFLTPDGHLNYAAYLLADNNGLSIKLAKYRGFDRVELIENNEYGYCCLVKACKQVLDKLAVENSIATQITPKERIDTPLLNPTALREAVINAIVHNDYTNEVSPKFELFADRIEITSAGGLAMEISREEFFKGYSVPKNKELMRVFKDLELVEHLGSGMPRILSVYPKEVFEFSANFTRISFVYSHNPSAKLSEQIPNQSSDIANITSFLSEEMSEEISNRLLSCISENQTITIRQLAKLLGASTRTIERHLSKLKRDGRVERIGPRKGGRWKVN